MSDSEDPVDVPEGGDDLFGEESDNERPLSDHELDDEDDDRQRDEDGGGEDEGPVEFKQTRVQDQVVYRHRAPKPKDGVLRTMRIPDFLRVIPEQYKEDAYQPTELDLAEDRKKYPASAIRWRRNPETGKPESNAVIYRWSDGSVTLAVGDQHYEVDVKSLAPPAKSYDARRDANYYAAAAHLSSNMMLSVGHITEEYKVKPNAALENAAVDRLMATMDAATKNRHADEGVIFRAAEDPETLRKQAELAEKERERARRRKENAAARLDAGPSARRAGGGGGLSISGLESGERSSGRRGKGPGGAQRQKRRNPEYDSDDDLPQGARRGDDYDMGDDFIAPSDEEISQGEDDDEEELLDEDDEEEERRAPRAKRQRTAESVDDDADGDEDAPAAHADQAGRRGRRHIVDDDDE